MNPNAGGNMMESMQMDSAPEENHKIRSLLDAMKANPNDFDTLLRQLYEELMKNPGVNLASYFKGCTQSFIEYVTASLERINYQQRGNPFGTANDGLPQNSFQDVKYQMKPLNQNNTLPQKTLPQNAEFASQGNIDINENKFSANNTGGSGNYESYVNKVHSLKERYGMILGKNQENQGQNSVNIPNPITLKDARDHKVLNNNMSSVNQGGFDQGMNNASMLTKSMVNPTTNMNPAQPQMTYSGVNNSAGMVGNINGANNQYGKTTENILQKLNEMKAKVQNIVNPNKNSM